MILVEPVMLSALWKPAASWTVLVALIWTQAPSPAMARVFCRA